MPFAKKKDQFACWSECAETGFWEGKRRSITLRWTPPRTHRGWNESPHCTTVQRAIATEAATL